MKRRTITISFACNDDRGEFARHAEMADFLECSLCWQRERPVTMQAGKNFIRIHRQAFPFLRRVYWHGNMAWDAFVFDRAVAMRLIEAMRRNGNWSVDCAPVRLGNWFERRTTPEPRT